MHYFTKSKIFLYFCLSFIVGIAVASLFHANDLVLSVFLVAAIIIISVFWRKKRMVALAFCLVFLLAGMHRSNSFFSAEASGKSGSGLSAENAAGFESLDGDKISWSGLIISSPDYRASSIYYYVEPRPSLLSKEGFAYGDKILVIMPLGADYQYGDLVEFRGKLKLPPTEGKFSWRERLAGQGIYFMTSYPQAKIIAHDAFCQTRGEGNWRQEADCQKYRLLASLATLKFKMADIIGKNMPEPEASLAAAILFGNDKTMPKELLDKFNATGTRHIMAVSGQNITIMVLLLMNLALALGGSRRVAFYFAFISIVFYIILIGFPASAVRAGIMGLLLLIAERMGRLSVSYRALVFAASLMLASNPGLLAFDAGFQLSFAATAGIIFIYPMLFRRLSRVPNAFEIRSSLAMTLAALAATLPVSLLSFGQISLISPLANVLIVPAVPIVMILGFVIIVFGAILPGLAAVIGWFAWLVLAYEVKTVEFLSGFSFSSVKMETIGTIYATAYYLALAVVLIKARGRKTEKAVAAPSKN